MKATDLMLGDWVLCDGEPYQIAEISAGLLCIDAEHELFANPEDLESIPLTPEILDKNGFLYKKLKGIGGDSEIWRLADDYFDIDIYEWSDSIWVFRYDCCEMSLPHTQVTMSYVHELQRALRDCGLSEIANNIVV